LSTEDLATLSVQNTQLQQWAGSLSVRQSGVDGLQGVSQIEVPVPEDFADRLQTILRLQAWSDRVSATAQAVRGKRVLGELPLGDTRELTSRLKSWQVLTQLQVRYQALASVVERLREELAQAEEDVRETQQEVKELGACPTCARPLGEEGSCHA
jgi:DNA repair exonuclease SbcCD ATPase subunit